MTAQASKWNTPGMSSSSARFTVKMVYVCIATFWIFNERNMYPRATLGGYPLSLFVEKFSMLYCIFISARVWQVRLGGYPAGPCPPFVEPA